MKVKKRRAKAQVEKIARAKGPVLTERFPPKIKALLDLVRPFTLLAPIIGGTSAAIISFKINSGHFIPWPVVFDTFPFVRWDFPEAIQIVWGVIALVLVTAASNTLNQVYDLDIDLINKPYRPIPSGILTKDEARTLAWVLYLITLWRASFLNRSFAFFILLIMLMTIAYSVPPIRFKKRLWINNLSIAFTRGLLGFMAAWCIFDGNPLEGPHTWAPWAMGLIMAIYLFGTVTTKDFTDIKGDRKFGIRTLPVVYGIRFSALFTAIFFILPFVFLPIFTGSKLLIKETAILLVLVIWGFYVNVLINNASYNIDDQHFENSPVWKHMYLMLLALQMGFLLIYYFYA